MAERINEICLGMNISALLLRKDMFPSFKLLRILKTNNSRADLIFYLLIENDTYSRGSVMFSLIVYSSQLHTPHSRRYFLHFDDPQNYMTIKRSQF
jgi:hypothetical protein